ncbi:MAG: hypothetical protein JW892_05110 [Anaerolineae bacterium]|nr:hypothetical protein [Anaerolineae bacterium]
MSMWVREKDRSLSLSSLEPQLGLLGLLLLFISGTAVIAFSVVYRTPSVIFAFLSFGILGLLSVLRAGKSAVSLYVWVYCINVLIALSIYLVYLKLYGVPYYYGGSDDLDYERWAQDVVHGLSMWQYSAIRGEIVGPYHNSVGYIYWISLLYRMGELLGGFNTMIPRLFNSMLLGLMTVLVFLIATSNLLPRNTARAIALFVGLLPIMTFNAAHTFRDILLSFIMLWVVFSWNNVITGVSRKAYQRAWLWSAIGIGLMWELRQVQAIALLLLAFLFDSLLVQRSRRPKSFDRSLHIIILCVLMGIGLWHIGFGYIISRMTFYGQSYTTYRLGISSGLSNYIFSAPLPISLVLRVFYGLIVPLPLVGQRFEEMYQGLGTLVHMFFLPFLFLGLRQPFCSRSKGLWVLSFLVFYGMNLATFTSRHIVIFLPYAALVAGWGYSRYRKYRAPIWLAVFCAGVALAIVYGIMKL